MDESQKQDDVPEKSQDSHTSNSDKHWEEPSEEKLDREDERDIHRSNKNSKDTFFY